MSHFLSSFPGMYVNQGWPTADNIIPYKLFYVMTNALPYVWAMNRMLAASAYTQAKAITHSKTKAKAQRTMDKMERAALPTRKV